MKARSRPLGRPIKGRGRIAALFGLTCLLLAATPAWAGPMWWKVSDGGGSVLWILGMPDGMPMDTKWDDAGLRRRLGAADRLISPLLGEAVSLPGDCWTPGEWVRTAAPQSMPPPPPPPPPRRSPDSSSDSSSSPPPPPVQPLRPPPSAWASGPRSCAPGSLHGQAQESFGLTGSISYAISTSPGGVVNQNKVTSLIWSRTLGRGSADPAHRAGAVMVYPVPEGPLRTFKDPLKDRLPAGLMARVNAAMPRILGSFPTALRNGKTWEMALWLDLWNWPRNKLLGNPVTTKAQGLAKNARLPIDIVYVPALWKPMLLDPAPYPPGSEPWADFDWLWQTRPSENEPPEALQQKCLTQVLDQTETKAMPAARMAAVEAWARGDLAHALKRSNGVQLCLMGDLPSTSVQDFEVRQAQLYIEKLDRAFETKGQTVALVEFDPLLLSSGGVLDHYRKLGFEISTGNGVE